MLVLDSVNVSAGFCLADGQRTGLVEYLAERAAVHELTDIHHRKYWFLVEQIVNESCT